MEIVKHPDNKKHQYKQGKYIDKIDKDNFFEVKSYHELIEIVAELSFLYKDNIIFFRGQNTEHQNQNLKASFYPSIYRGKLTQEKLNEQFKILNNASIVLSHFFEIQNILGYKMLKRKKEIQWSILQHYHVCKTPFLDLTHSLRVACTFAVLDKNHKTDTVKTGNLYLFAMPYPTNRISYNSEEEIVSIRLLNICPPNALRPYYQEGYLFGTPDVLNYFDSKDEKSELDFNRRLIAKIKFNNDDDFWANGFKPLQSTDLYPNGNDGVFEISKKIIEFKEKGILQNPTDKFKELWAQFIVQIKSNGIEIEDAAMYLDNNSYINETVTLTKIIKEMKNGKEVPNDMLFKNYLYIDDILKKLNM